MADAVQTLGLDISQFEASLRDAQASLSKGAERSIRAAQRALAVAIKEQATANRVAAEAQRAAAQAQQVEQRELIRLQRERAAEAAKQAAAAKAAASATSQLQGIAARRTEEEALTHAFREQVAQIQELIRVSGDQRAGAAALAQVAEEQRQALEGVKKGAGSAGAATWQLTQQTMSLRRNLGDVANSLLAGASPFTVLAQQGPQVIEIFAETESAAGLLKSSFGGLAARVAALAAPLAALAAVVAVVGTTAIAMYNAFEQSNPELYQVRIRLEQVDEAAKKAAISMLELVRPVRDAGRAARDAQDDLAVLTGTLDRHTVAERRAIEAIDDRNRPVLEAAAADLAATEAALQAQRQILQTVGAYEEERRVARERVEQLLTQRQFLRDNITALKDYAAAEKKAVADSAEYSRELDAVTEAERKREEAARRAEEAARARERRVRAARDAELQFVAAVRDGIAVFDEWAKADAAASATAAASQLEVLRLTAETTGALRDRLVLIEAAADAQVEAARVRLEALVEVGRAEEAAALLAEQTGAIRARAAKAAADAEAEAARAAGPLADAWVGAEAAVGAAARELAGLLPSVRELAGAGMAAARGLGQSLGAVAGPGLDAVTSIDGALQALGGQVEAEARATEAVAQARAELRDAVASGDSGAVEEARAGLRAAKAELEGARPEAFIRELIGSSTRIVQGMVDALPGFVRGLVAAAPRLIQSLVAGVPDLVRALVRATPQIAIALATALAIELPLQLIAEAPAIAKALALGIGEAFVNAARRIRQVIGDVLREIATGGRADTKTFGDTPGPTRVGPRGARVSPGDHVVAARSEAGLRAQVRGLQPTGPQTMRLELDVRAGPVQLGIVDATSRAIRPADMRGQHSPWRR
jgi:hypothetical protein